MIKLELNGHSVVDLIVAVMKLPRGYHRDALLDEIRSQLSDAVRDVANLDAVRKERDEAIERADRLASKLTRTIESSPILDQLAYEYLTAEEKKLIETVEYKGMIPAIKSVRERTRLELKPAKDIIDAARRYATVSGKISMAAPVPSA